jgi:hypothetical protein
MNVRQLVRTSLNRAKNQPVDATSRRQLHRRRSRIWVETLADAFRLHFAGDPTVRVFSKHNPSNRADFGLNELLYDVTVCRVGTVSSTKHQKVLYYVREALWQVESEFARDSREALVDFSKLVLGAGCNKLFIGPQVSDIKGLLDVLKPAARACEGRVYVSLVPHPADWIRGEMDIRVWEMRGSNWESV